MDGGYENMAFLIFFFTSSSVLFAFLGVLY
jgi:hypothetical protein